MYCMLSTHTHTHTHTHTTSPALIDRSTTLIWLWIWLKVLHLTPCVVSSTWVCCVCACLYMLCVYVCTCCAWVHVCMCSCCVYMCVCVHVVCMCVHVVCTCGARSFLVYYNAWVLFSSLPSVCVHPIMLHKLMVCHISISTFSHNHSSQLIQIIHPTHFFQLFGTTKRVSLTMVSLSPGNLHLGDSLYVFNILILDDLLWLVRWYIYVVGPLKTMST